MPTSSIGGVDVDALVALSSQLAHTPDADKAVAVSLNSAKLEDYFRLMRERAQAIARGLNAQAEMKTMAPEPEMQTPAAHRVQPVPGKVVRESIFAFTPESTEAPKKPAAPTLAEFFATVTQSIVNAQSALDLQSLSYARQLEGTPIPPVHFSIPNVHAEVKMGFNVEDRSNVLVQLFGKPEDSSDYGETTISFDVATSPPPPGSEFSSPIPMFLVVPPEKDRILNASAVPAAQRSVAVLLKNSASAPLSDTKTRYLAIVPRANAVTIYRLTESGENSQSFDVSDDAGKVLSDFASILQFWLQSVTLPAAK